VQRKLIPFHNPNSLEAEAYRILSTNLKFSNPDNPLKTVAITSPAPSEGKSLTCANLATAVAQSGERVLLIDCDLRHPTLHQLFGVDLEPGLTNVILGNVELPAACLYTPVKGLQILPAGHIPPNPAELLGSKKMRTLILQMKEHADLIIIDTPPASIITDAALIAAVTDGVLLVIESGKTVIDQAIKTKEILSNVRANVLGVVINKATGHKSKNYYYHYYYSKKAKKRK